MGALVLDPEERSIVVFKVWQSLPYVPRMLIAVALVIGGIVLQCLGGPPAVGWIAILVGNLLLVVQGYDNRVTFDAYSPDAAWESISEDKLEEFTALQKRVTAWDRSLLDVSNPLGAVAFVVLGAVIVVLLQTTIRGNLAFVFLIDAALLFAPHWCFGMRRVTLLMKPALNVKIDALLYLATAAKRDLEALDATIDYLVHLTGKKPRVPKDVKLRIDFPQQSDDFLGFYVQVVTNNVQGRDYPYVYTVVVAKRGYGLDRIVDDLPASVNLTQEFECKKDVEYIVVRQTTTKTSGYHTKPADTLKIFRHGFDAARKAVALSG